MKTKLFTLLFAIVASVGTLFAETETVPVANGNWEGTSISLKHEECANGSVSVMKDNTGMNETFYKLRTNKNNNTITLYVNAGYSIKEIYLRGFSNNTTSEISLIGVSIDGVAQKPFTSITFPSKNSGYTDSYSNTTCNASDSIVLTFDNSGIDPSDNSNKYCQIMAQLTVTYESLYINAEVDGIWYNFDSSKETAEVTYNESSYYHLGEYFGEVTIPSEVTYSEIIYSVTSIGDYAFAYCSGLTSVTISNSVTSIGRETFRDCSSMTSISLPNSVTCIGMGAFGYCSGLTSVTIPNSVTTIEDNAFFGCTGLTSVTIPNSVTRIGDYVFGNCSNLAAINVIENNQVYSSVDGVLFDKNKTELLQLSAGNHSTSYVIPNSVISIRDGAFYECSSLLSVTIPNNVTNIGSNAFGNCNGLTSVVIPNSVTSIGDEAFAYCSSLTSVTMGNSITNIGKSAFKNCSSLTDIYAACGDLDRVKQLLNNDNRVKYAPYPSYTINKITKNGSISNTGTEMYTICDAPFVSCTATPNYGYHFAQWSDGNTDNPRTIELTQDTTMEAVFEINKHFISVTCDDSQGSIEGESGEFDFLTELTFKAVPKYGYHFTGWSDDVTTNPRTIELTQDSTFEAIFAPNSYTISCNSSTNGHIDGIGTFDYLSACTLTAVPDNGYHFVQWSDGVTDNPRKFVLVQDTTFTAEIAADTNGQCGDNLYWSLNDDILTITGSGDMWQGQPWVASNAAIKQVNLPQGLTSIGNRAFYYCSNLSSIEIPNSVKRIDDQAFRSCAGLTSIEIPNSIESIGAKTFYYCTSLTSVIIPNSITRIEEGTFYGCSNLSSVAIGNSVSYIGYEAFRYCSKLSSLEIPNSVETIDSKAFRECGSLTSIIVGKSLTNIGEYAFRDCSNITSVVWNAKNCSGWNFGSQVTSFTFGNEVEVIPASICSGMNQLTIMTIPNSVTKIETKAFYNCSGLTKLTLGSGLQSIDEYAFAECKNFDDITCYATTVPTIYATTFDNIGNKQYIYLFVPEGRQRAYKRDTYWGEFDVQIKNAESVTIPDENVIITPTDNSVEIIWPAVANTKTYEIVITKGDEKICTLVFNEQGQLNEISFAPARYERQEQTSGFQFTVTSLASGTTYGYSVIAKDDIGNPIDSKSGSFTTTGVATAHDQITNDQSPITNKIIKDNQILILRGDKTYTLQGQEVK